MCEAVDLGWSLRPYSLTYYWQGYCQRDVGCSCHAILGHFRAVEDIPVGEAEMYQDGKGGRHKSLPH